MYGFFIGVEKWSKGKLTNWLLKPIMESIKEIKERLAKGEIDILKVIIMSEEMPLEERLQAGERYINLGGNSAIKIHYKELQREYEESIKK